MGTHRARPGQDIYDTPMGHSETQNRVLEATELVLRNRNSKATANQRSNRVPTDVIKVKNLAGADLARGSVLQVGVRLPDELKPWAIWFEGNEPNEPCGQVVAILLKAALQDKIVPAQISGVCMALVNVTDTDHRYAYPVTGETVLQSGHGGPFQLLEPATGVEEAEFAVVFGQPRVSQHRHGINEDALSQGGTVTVSIIERIGGEWQHVGIDITAVDLYMNSGESIAAGHLMRIDFDCKEWVVENWYCDPNDTGIVDDVMATSDGDYLITNTGALLEI